MAGRRKSLKPQVSNKIVSQVKQQQQQAETPETASSVTTIQEIPDERSDVCLVQDISLWSDPLASLDPEDETTCGACAQLMKGSITQFMTSEKFLEKYPERIEGESCGLSRH